MKLDADGRLPRWIRALNYLAAAVLVGAVVWLALWFAGKRSWIPRAVLAHHEIPGVLSFNGGGHMIKCYADPSRGFLLRWVNWDQAVSWDRMREHRGEWTEDLLKPPLDGHIWRFDPAAGTFVASSAGEWLSLVEQPPPLGGPRTPDPKTGARRDLLPGFRDRWRMNGPRVEGRWDSIIHDGREFALPEPYLQQFSISPGGAYLLVLMRNGRYARTSWWGDGRSPTGYLYVVIYSTASGKPVTPVYRVGDLGASWGAQWTIDSRYVLLRWAPTDTNPPLGRMFVLPNPDLVSAQPKIR